MCHSRTYIQKEHRLSWGSNHFGGRIESLLPPLQVLWGDWAKMNRPSPPKRIGQLVFFLYRHLIEPLDRSIRYFGKLSI